MTPTPGPTSATAVPDLGLPAKLALAACLAGIALVVLNRARAI